MRDLYDFFPSIRKIRKRQGVLMSELEGYVADLKSRGEEFAAARGKLLEEAGHLIPEVALEDGQPEFEMRDNQDLFRDMLRKRIFEEILNERSHQLDKWGDQTRPLGASATYKQIADIHRDNCNEAEVEGTATWRHIALEELWEAFSESDRDAFRIEAVQTMAVLFSALEDLFRDEFTP